MTKKEHLIIIQTRLDRIERLIKSEQNITDAKEDDSYMTISEASNYTRFSVSTLRRCVDSGELNCTRTGGLGNGKLIFKKSTLTEWLEREVE